VKEVLQAMFVRTLSEGLRQNVAALDAIADPGANANAGGRLVRAPRTREVPESHGVHRGKITGTFGNELLPDRR
jgi:hypothetical protein